MAGRTTGRAGRELQIEGRDGSFDAYLATPASGRGPGLLVLQEWWGLVPHIRDVCDRLARAGYVALAPDLYHGDSTTDPDAAGRMMMDLQIERAGRDLEAAAGALLRQPEVDGARIGCIGFCMGGQLALHAACLCPEIRAVVDCYGVHPRVVLDFDECKAKVFGVFAENDDFIPAEAVEALRETLGLAGVEHRLVTYEGVSHAFLNDSRPEVYSADRAAEAWRDIEAFLGSELR
jgi:carboxymethylenebutenolidase